MDIKPIETSYADRRFRSRLEARWAVFATPPKTLEGDLSSLLLRSHRVAQPVFTVVGVLRLSLGAIQKPSALLFSMARKTSPRAVFLYRRVLRCVAMAMFTMWPHLNSIHLLVARYAQGEVVAGSEAVEASSPWVHEQAHRRRLRTKRSLDSLITTAGLADLIQNSASCVVSTIIGRVGGKLLFHVLDYTTVLQELPSVLRRNALSTSARFEFGEEGGK